MRVKYAGAPDAYAAGVGEVDFIFHSLRDYTKALKIADYLGVKISGNKEKLTITYDVEFSAGRLREFMRGITLYPCV